MEKGEVLPVSLFLHHLLFVAVFDLNSWVILAVVFQLFNWLCCQVVTQHYEFHQTWELLQLCLLDLLNTVVLNVNKHQTLEIVRILNKLLPQLAINIGPAHIQPAHVVPGVWQKLLKWNLALTDAQFDTIPESFRVVMIFARSVIVEFGNLFVVAFGHQPLYA